MTYYIRFFYIDKALGASIDHPSCGIRLDRLADHVVAPQQLAWQGARALVVRKGHGAIDERIAQPGGLLDQATLTPWEVGCKDGLVVQVAELLQVIDDDVGPIPHPQRPTTFEGREPGG